MIWTFRDLDDKKDKTVKWVVLIVFGATESKYIRHAVALHASTTTSNLIHHGIQQDEERSVQSSFHCFPTVLSSAGCCTALWRRQVKVAVGEAAGIHHYERVTI
jgi:hypothetical protein